MTTNRRHWVCFCHIFDDNANRIIFEKKCCFRPLLCYFASFMQYTHWITLKQNCTFFCQWQASFWEHFLHKTSGSFLKAPRGCLRLFWSKVANENDKTKLCCCWDYYWLRVTVWRHQTHSTSPLQIENVRHLWYFWALQQWHLSS